MTEPNTGPAWGFRRASNGVIEHRLFENGRPDGWADSPARVDEIKPQKPRRGRPRKSE